MKILVCHASWLDERKRTLARLLEQLPSAEVLSSKRREHARVWAYRAWERAEELDDDCVILNDDVTVCPHFELVVEAMLAAQPGRVLSLHTSVPQAAGLAQQGHPWVRCYWLTGPAYVLPRGVPGRLLDFWASLPWSFASSRNEDNIAMHWMWEEQAPAWSSIPALVTHDTTTASTLGYDNHPLRRSCVPWELYRDPSELTEPDHWRRDDAPFVECPWLNSPSLSATRQLLRTSHPLCTSCWQAPALVRPGDAALCPRCLGAGVSSVMQHLAGQRR